MEGGFQLSALLTVEASPPAIAGPVSHFTSEWIPRAQSGGKQAMAGVCSTARTWSTEKADGLRGLSSVQPVRTPSSQAVFCDKDCAHKSCAVWDGQLVCLQRAC